MSHKQFRFIYRRVISRVAAILLVALTALPALANDAPEPPGDRPFQCCRVVPDDRVAESGDCLGGGVFHFPDYITQPQYSPRLAGSDEAIGSTGRSPDRPVGLPAERNAVPYR